MPNEENGQVENPDKFQAASGQLNGTPDTPPPSDSPIQKKNAEIHKERVKGSLHNRGFSDACPDRQYAYGNDKLFYISRAVDNFYGRDHATWKHAVTDWNFPYAVGDKKKTHVVARWYCVDVYVDVFDEGTPKSEIERIKAHMEAIGKRYTYTIGGEKGDKWDNPEELGKLLFEKRLPPLKVPFKVNVPHTMDHLLSRSTR